MNIKDIFVTPTHDPVLQLVRYFFVGGTAFAVDFGLLYLLTSVFGFHYLLSATLAFIAGLTVNYIISTRWVFGRSKVIKRRWAEFAAFAAIGVAGLLLNDLIMWMSVELVSLHYLIGKLIATATVFMWNFLARRFLIYR